MLIEKLKKYSFSLFCVLAWNKVWNTIAVFISSFCLKLKCRTWGIVYGKNIRANGWVVIHCARRGSIRIGDHFLVNSRFHSNLVGATNPTVWECSGEGYIHIGDNTGMSFTVISSRAGVEIGDFVKVGGNVRIFDHDYHSLNYQNRRDGTRDKEYCRMAPVRIGNDVFVGTNSIILKGTTIGDRSVIGAGSVVSGNIPPDEIWAGNPARFIRQIKKQM